MPPRLARYPAGRSVREDARRAWDRLRGARSATPRDSAHVRDKQRTGTWRRTYGRHGWGEAEARDTARSHPLSPPSLSPSLFPTLLSSTGSLHPPCRPHSLSRPHCRSSPPSSLPHLFRSLLITPSPPPPFLPPLQITTHNNRSRRALNTFARRCLTTLHGAVKLRVHASKRDVRARAHSWQGRGCA